MKTENIFQYFSRELSFIKSVIIIIDINNIFESANNRRYLQRARGDDANLRLYLRLRKRTKTELPSRLYSGSISRNSKKIF